MVVRYKANTGSRWRKPFEQQDGCHWPMEGTSPMALHNLWDLGNLGTWCTSGGVSKQTSSTTPLTTRSLSYIHSTNTHTHTHTLTQSFPLVLWCYHSKPEYKPEKTIARHTCTFMAVNAVAHDKKQKLTCDSRARMLEVVCIHHSICSIDYRTKPEIYYSPRHTHLN